MTFWEFFNMHFWYGMLIIILASNKNTFVSSILLASILIINDGKCPFGWLVFVVVVSIFTYLITFDSIWKRHYEVQIKRLKRKIWNLENH